jgi:DNA repair/transcription protein MET18/MMS19
MREMGDYSLVGVTSLVAGEKDPRNLMLIFSMLRAIMVEWDISQHSETMFDSVYAYFPITFRPPPNDPYGITAKDLKDRLRDCLASSGVLAPHAIPNLLDRLDSTSPTVKKDVLQALAACAINYDTTTMAQYSITLWDAVKFEVLQAQEPELAEEALLVIKDIAISLSKNANSSATASPLVQYLMPINKECMEHLQEPASRQARASGDILKAAASATVKSFEIVVKRVGPALLTLQQSSQETIQQRAILEVTNQLFEAALEVYGSWTSLNKQNPEGRDNLLNEFKDRLVSIYSQALMGTVKEEVSFRLTAAKGLLLLSRMRSLLQDDEIGLFVQYYNDIVLTEESYGRDELKVKAMQALAEISKFKPRLISEITLPAFMAHLPDTEAQAETSRYKSVLEALAEISIEKDLLETTMRRLLNKLDILFRSEDQRPFPYTCAILGTVRYILDRTVQAGGVKLDSHFDRVVIGLSRSAAEAHSGPLTDEVVVDILGRVSNIISRYSTLEHSRRVADNIYTLFRDSMTSIMSDVRLPFAQHTPLILSTWLLASLPRTLQVSAFQADQMKRIMDDLLVLGDQSKAPAVELSCLRQIALYVNKHLANHDLELVEHLLDQRLQSLARNNAHSQSFGFSIRLSFFLVKALVLRLAPKTNLYLGALVNLLGSQYQPTISAQAASLFRVILAPDDVLSKMNFAQIRLLAPQRIFQVLTPLIAQRFRDSSLATEKENHLIALSGILSSVPSEIVIPELPTLLPLLLQSLDISDQTVKIATLETLAVVIANNPSALEQSGHVPALAKRLLGAASSPRVGHTKVAQVQNLARTRRLAVRCLMLMPKHISGSGSMANPLLMLKKEVLRGLMAVLDDPKRDVRKEAVDARATWSRNVDDPVDDGDDE